MTSDEPRNPVVVEGTAERVTGPDVLRAVLDADNAKCGTDYDIELLDPAMSACFRFRPTWAFALLERDFTGGGSSERTEAIPANRATERARTTADSGFADHSLRRVRLDRVHTP